MRGVRKTNRYAEIVGERVKAGERKEESNQSIKKEYNAMHAVHENVMKYLKGMFYMTLIPGTLDSFYVLHLKHQQQFFPRLC